MRCCQLHTVQKVGLVLDSTTAHGRRIFEGILAGIPDPGGINLIELPHHSSGRPPLKSNLEKFGALIVYADHKHQWIPKLADRGVRIISCGGDWAAHEKIITIGTSLLPIVDIMVDHFHHLSFKHLAFFGYKALSDPNRSQLVDNLRAKAEPLGLDVQAIEVHGGDDPETEITRHLIGKPGKKLLRSFEKLPNPIGIVCENDHYARLACQIAHALGKKIPRDMGILGGGNEFVSHFAHPSISSIHYPSEEIGRLAASLLTVKDPPLRNPVLVTADHLVIRESTGGANLDVQMERVRRWIDQHLLKSPTMAELSEVAGCSAKTLRQKYLKIYGIDPLADIRNRRLDEIKRLLQESEMQLATIASICGFSSQAAFYNYVMRHCGQQPSQLRGTPKKELQKS